jgi:hypothetical protein
MLLDIILARWQRPVASSEALDLLHWAMHAIMYRRIAMAIKMASFVGVFIDCCFLPVALAAAGQYGVCSHPMAASSAFRSSPGHAASGDVLSIAPADCHGHQNRWQTRYI